jgi:O-antigen/teichoic acid export membrane protein
MSEHASRRRSDVRELAVSGAVTFGGGFGGAVCTLLLLVLLSRQSGVTTTGLFFQAVALTSTLAILCSAGAPITLMQRIARALAHDERRLESVVAAAVVPVLVASVGAAVVLGVASVPVAHVMTQASHRDELQPLLVAMAPAVPLIALTRLAVMVSRGCGHTAPAALYDSGGLPLLRLVLVGVVAVGDHPVWCLGAAYSLASVLCLAGAVPHAGRSLRSAGAAYAGGLQRDRTVTRDFWAFSLPRGLEELFTATNVWLLVVLVGALASPAAATTYSAISRFTLASSLLMQAVTTGMAPRLTAAFTRGERERAKNLFDTATLWIVGLSVPASLTLLLFPGALLHLVSPELHGGQTGLRIMAAVMLVNVVTGPAGAAILFAGRSRWNLWIAVAGFAAMLVVAVAAIPGTGANGASAAWAAAIVVQSVIGYAVVQRAFGLVPLTPAVLRLAAVSAVVPALCQGAALALWDDTLRALVVGTAVAGVALLGVHVISSWRLWKGPHSEPAPWAAEEV